MSEMMGSNDFAQNSITRAQSGFSFRDNNAVDAYHGYDRHFDANQASENYLSIDQQNLQPSYNVFQSTSFIYGQEHLQHLYQPLHDHIGQEAVQDDMQNLQDYGPYYHPSESYPTSHVANSIPSYFRQDGAFWEDNLHQEEDLNEHDLVDEEVITSIPTRSRTTAAQNDQIYKNEPYAKLIFIALRSAPGHKMVLKDIYKWFERFTDKAQPGSKGWQNSIRHNLSMNVAFLKEETGNDASDGKRNYVWALSKEALKKGSVESTTRFRKHPKKASLAQPSYRVSKAPIATVSRTIPSPRYLLPPYDQVWSKDTARTQHKQDFEELQALQPQNSTQTHEIPQESAQATSQPQSYQFFPNEYLSAIHSIDEYEPNPERTLYPGYEVAAPFQQPLKYELQESIHPFEPAATEEHSPTPSMTVTNSSFGYREMTEEERHYFENSPYLQPNTLQSGEQSHSKPRMSYANPYSTNYEE